jgi:hypothetical protein
MISLTPVSNAYVYLIIIGGIMFSTAVSALNHVPYLEESNIQSKFEVY